MGSACSRGADSHVVVVAPLDPKQNESKLSQEEKDGKESNDTNNVVPNAHNSTTGDNSNKPAEDNGAPLADQFPATRVIQEPLRVESVVDLITKEAPVIEEPRPTSPASPTSATKKHEDQLVMWVSKKLKNKLKLNRIAKAYERFIPSTFYGELGKHDIKEVDIGECVLVRKSVIFADIRNFTNFSSRLGPQDTFKFLNALSRRLLPIVRKYGGYIDKFIGDALVALFPSAADGVAAGLDIMDAIDEYNAHRVSKNYETIRVGIGCHTGALMLGTVGDNERMDGVALGSTMALSSQVEAATKIFGVDFIITHATQRGLNEEHQKIYHWRKVGMIKEGAEEQVVYQVFRKGTELPPETLAKFDEGVTAFYCQQFKEAVEIFNEVLAVYPKDRPTLVLEDRAKFFISKPNLPSDWENGLTYHTVHMTKAGPSVLASGLKDSAPPGIISHNFGLMRLVFSAIFHMQAMVAPTHSDTSSDADDIDFDDSDFETEVEHNPLMETIASVRQQNLLKTAREATMPGYEEQETSADSVVDEEKEKQLITLVLSGFENHNRVSYLTKAYQRFLPNDFLNHLGKEDIQHVDIGDSIMTNMTVMFIEMRGFAAKPKIPTEKSMQMINSLKKYQSTEGGIGNQIGGLAPPPTRLPPVKNRLLAAESSRTTLTTSTSLTRSIGRSAVTIRSDLITFQFLNTINHRLMPIIRNYDGYVDKFFGNAVLALFPSVENATKAGLEILAIVKKFNENGEGPAERMPAYAHIGMNTGPVILGTVGDNQRMDGTVIGNTVNVAARMLSLTKVYGARFVTTDRCIAQLHDPHNSSGHNLHNLNNNNQNHNPNHPHHKHKKTHFHHRVLDTVVVPGKDEPIIVAEILEPDSAVAHAKDKFEHGLTLYKKQKFAEALKVFDEMLLDHPLDVPSQIFAEKCSRYMKEGVPPDWDGVTVVSVK